MKDHPFDTIGDVPVEARIVAWILGEASAFEAAELERLCEERPELLVFRHRMLALHGLLTEVEAAEPDNSWKLPAEKRQALDAILGEGKVTPPDRQSERTVLHSARRALLATAACLALTSIVAGLYYSSDPGRSGDTALISDAIKADNTKNLNSIPPPSAEGAFKVNSTAMSPSRGAGLQEAARQGQLARQPVQEGFRTSGSTGSSDLPGPEDASRMESMPPISATETSDGLAHAETSPGGFFKDLPAPAAPMGSDRAPGTWTTPSARAGRGLVDAPAAGSNTTRFPALENPVMSPSEAQAQPTSVLEEIPAAENPYSTFSLNVSDASFQQAKATLAKGERPDPASIEPEQFYNAVDYGDPAPRPDEPVAVTIEQSVHPVISGRNLIRVAVRTGSVGKNDDLALQPAGAFRPAAENVKVQVIFNPQRVKSYKLIGFETGRPASGDFPNDSGKAGVGLYQVEPLAAGAGNLGEVSVRFRDTASREMVERSWTMPYDPQTVTFHRATPSMQLAGLSMLAAEKLKGGRSAAGIDFKQLTGASDSVKEFYGASSRVGEMLQLIEKLK